MVRSSVFGQRQVLSVPVGVDAVVFTNRTTPLLLFGGCRDGTVRAWDVQSGRALNPPREHHDTGGTWPWCASLFCSADDTQLVSGGRDGCVMVWAIHVQSAQPLVHVQTLRGHEEWVECVTMSINAQFIISSDSDTIILWRNGVGFEQCASLGDAPGSPSPGQQLCVAPDGEHLISAGMDAGVVVWSLAKMAAVRMAPATPQGGGAEVNSVALSADQRYILCGTFGSGIRILDFNTLQVVHFLDQEAHQWVKSIHTPVFRFALAAYGTGAMIAWDLAHGGIIAGEYNVGSECASVRFSDDAHYAAVAVPLKRQIHCIALASRCSAAQLMPLVLARTLDPARLPPVHRDDCGVTMASDRKKSTLAALPLDVIRDYVFPKCAYYTLHEQDVIPEDRFAWSTHAATQPTTLPTALAAAAAAAAPSPAASSFPSSAYQMENNNATLAMAVD